MTQGPVDERLERYARVLHEWDGEAGGPFVMSEYLAAAAGAIIEIADAEQQQVASENERLTVEVERLQGVEFIHNGCAMLRESDNAHLLGRLRDVELKLELARGLARWWWSGPSANKDTMTRAFAAAKLQEVVGNE